MESGSKNKVIFMGIMGLLVIIAALVIVTWLPKGGETVKPSETGAAVIKVMTCEDLCKDEGYFRAIRNYCIDLTECKSPYKPLIGESSFCREMQACCCI